MDAEIFRRISTERASGQIVDRLTKAIRDGQLPVGERLPSEREMAEQLDVSRVTVRDALRILEARGLITVRVGAGGGAFVTAPVGSVVTEGLTDMLALSDLSPEEVTETRRALEVGAVPLVCERATDNDFAELERLCDEGDRAVADGDYDVGMSAQFHVRLAHATHNRAVSLLMEVLQDSMLHSLRRAREAAPQMGARGVREHRRIVEAMRAGDVETARAVMTEHLQRTASRVVQADREARPASAEGEPTSEGDPFHDRDAPGSGPRGDGGDPDPS